MPFEIQGPQRLDVRITLRLTAEEKTRLVEIADVAGLSVSELVRRRALGKPILASVDLAMIREVRRLGGLLKHVHTESGGAYSQTTAQALVAIKNYIETLSRDREKSQGQSQASQG